MLLTILPVVVLCVGFSSFFFVLRLIFLSQQKLLPFHLELIIVHDPRLLFSRMSLLVARFLSHTYRSGSRFDDLIFKPI